MRQALFVFAFTIFAGAFLLFQLQPLIGKYILPWFGGSPGVWTTCMLFFQVLLLGGYAYAHGLSRLAPRKQALIHCLLLALALAFIPVVPSQDWKPTAADSPVPRILLLLSVTVGVPYFVLSATGPLLQHWFGLRHPGRSPYRLYALSNAGSLLALISYPFLFEVWLSRYEQAWLWSAGLVAFAAACGACAYQVRNVPAPAPAEAGSPPAERPGMATRLQWVALPAVASLLLLSVTNKLCLDVAVSPFLWVLPLAIYLLSFILCFDHPRWYRRGPFAALFALCAAHVAHMLYAGNSVPIGQQIFGYSLALFAACMISHGELYRLRPAPVYATGFYLAIAAGGALGGLFVGVAAPLLFNRYYELQIGLCLLTCILGAIGFSKRDRALPLGMAVGLSAALLVVPALRIKNAGGVGLWLQAWWKEFDGLVQGYWLPGLLLAASAAFCLRRSQSADHRWRVRFAALPALLTVGLAYVLFNLPNDKGHGFHEVTSVRNFYGTLHVFEDKMHDPEVYNRSLNNGSTMHGLQVMSFPKRALPTSYYGLRSGVGLAFLYQARDPGHRRIGLVGLGTGTMLSYGWPGDRIRVYEINPEVVRVASDYFHYIRQSSGDVEMVLGDARLSMERERATGAAAQPFDLIVLDAFTSDAIPVHLLTKEAMQLYLDLLAKDGVLAIHVSNRYLDLEPVVKKHAEYFGLHSAYISDGAAGSWWLTISNWILLTRDPEILELPEIRFAIRPPRPTPMPEVKLWTDDYASLLPILR